MAKYAYPAIFTEDGSFYSVDFPDLEGCFTQGDDIVNALEMARDALSLMLCSMEDGDVPIPAASDISDLVIPEGEKGFVSMISCDTFEYRKLYESKSVKKTLSIPSWLNEEAIKHNINFSQVLQEALKARLGA